MIRHLFIIIVCLLSSFMLNAQGLEQYDSFETYTCIDNLDNRIIPKEFMEVYYSKISNKDFNVSEQKIDTLNNKRYVYVYTKKIKKGYLLINKRISDNIQKNKYNIDKLSLRYIQNGKTVYTKEQINKILKLREKDITSLDIRMNEDLYLINITTKM